MSKRTQILALAGAKGVVRPRDLQAIGADHSYLQRLLESGDIERVSRGLYSLPKSSVSAHRSLVEVATLGPQATICLLSALAFHDIGTQLPSAVWVAISHKARKPRIQTVPTVVVRMNAANLAADVVEPVIEGVPVRITSPVRTVVDCWRFRSRVGMETAIEALKDALRKRLFTNDELYECARKLRVWNVMKPYLEAFQS